ncbi:MAG: hypothetical protein AAB074_20070 [Planctomycetota bacterium]
MRQPTRKGKALKTSMLFVRLTPELHATLKALAESDRRNLSDLARVLLEDAVAARNSKKGGKHE